MKQEPATIELGHVHLFVRSLARSLDFYTRVLGLQETERLSRESIRSAADTAASIGIETFDTRAP